MYLVLASPCWREHALCVRSSDGWQKKGLKKCLYICNVFWTPNRQAWDVLLRRLQQKVQLVRKTMKAFYIGVCEPIGGIPQSNMLAEDHAGSILSASRAAFLQALLPMFLWVYAVRHGTVCKNWVKTSKTNGTPCKMVMGRIPTNITNVCLFGCWTLDHPVTIRQPTFKHRALEYLGLGNAAGIV